MNLTLEFGISAGFRLSSGALIGPRLLQPSATGRIYFMCLMALVILCESPLIAVVVPR